MNAYLEASVLIALGTVGELDRLGALDASPVVLPSVAEEVTTEPARSAVERAVEAGPLIEAPTPDREFIREAATILDDPEGTADVELLGAVLETMDDSESAVLVSDDRRLRTVARGLGAAVTGTIGVLVHAVDEGLNSDEAKAIVRRVDQHGLHMTAGLRERANELIDEAADGTA